MSGQKNHGISVVSNCVSSCSKQWSANTERCISVSGAMRGERNIHLEKTNPCSIHPKCCCFKIFFAATFYDIKTATIKLAWDPIELLLRWPGLVTRVRHLWWLVPGVWIQNQPPIWFLSPAPHRKAFRVSPPDLSCVATRCPVKIRWCEMQTGVDFVPTLAHQKVNGRFRFIKKKRFHQFKFIASLFQTLSRQHLICWNISAPERCWQGRSPVLIVLINFYALARVWLHNTNCTTPDTGHSDGRRKWSTAELLVV